MAVAKAPRRKPPAMDDLLSDVASFASSLGLSSSAGTASGFDDSDFRKTGKMRPVEPQSKVPIRDKSAKPIKNNPLEQIDPFEVSEKKVKGRFPLMKAATPMGLWYEESSELEARLTENSGQKMRTRGLEEVKRVAEVLMAQFTEDYETRTKKHGDWQLVRTAAKSGTTNDKVTALATLVGDNPVANLKSLDILLGLITAKVGKRYAFKGFDHLTELFKTRLLPDRKLKCLVQRQVNILPESSDGYSLLLFWYWEDCLKQRYERFVMALEEASKDMLPSLKDIATKLIYGLLRSKMEQERKLLYALVNKLGDPVRKAASSAAYYLTCLLSEHPNMKLVVIEEVDAFIFRPHVGLRSKYHAINFLSQIFLSTKGDGTKVAKRLVDIYFALFKVIISSGRDNTNDGSAAKKSGTNKITQRKKLGSRSIKMQENLMESCVEMDSRLLCALLTGVNRAFPYVASDEADDIIEVQTPILFKLVHSKNFNIGVQALTLLYQISFKNQILSDRFYRALYSKLLEPTALNSSKHEMFLALLFKAMKSDLNVKRISAFSKRLLQISLLQPPQYACGCLCLISEVVKAKSHLWSMMLQSESADEDLEHFTDVLEDAKEVTHDVSSEPIKSICSNAFLKEMDETKVVDSCYFSSEKSDLASRISCGDSEKESLKFCEKTPPVIRYNPRHREPAFCNAETAGWWELTLLAAHVHPSVAAMAQTLLSGVNIVYNGDPLIDLSLSAFLDKFMEKKPRASQRAGETWHGGSQIAPTRKPDLSSHLIGEEILQLAEDEVPPEDIVFHKFYANKSTSSRKKKKKKTTTIEEDEELVAIENDDSSNDEVEEMLGLPPLTSEDANGEYDYEDLDEVAVDDDDELIGDASDGEVEDDDDDDDNGDDENDDIDPNDVGIWNGESEGYEDLADVELPRKHKKNKRSQESPFVSVEDFEREKDKYLDRKRKPRQDRENKKKKRKNNPSA